MSAIIPQKTKNDGRNDRGNDAGNLPLTTGRQRFPNTAPFPANKGSDLLAPASIRSRRQPTLARVQLRRLL